MTTEPSATSGGKRAGIGKLLFGLMIAAAIAGIAISDFSPRDGIWYWTAMIPVFALVNPYTAATTRYVEGRCPACCGNPCCTG